MISTSYSQDEPLLATEEGRHQWVDVIDQWLESAMTLGDVKKMITDEAQQQQESWSRYPRFLVWC